MRLYQILRDTIEAHQPAGIPREWPLSEFACNCGHVATNYAAAMEHADAELITRLTSLGFNMGTKWIDRVDRPGSQK